MNERKEAAPCGQLSVRVLVASSGSQPRAQPFSQQAEKEKQIFLVPREGSGAPGSLLAPQALSVSARKCSGSLVSHTASFCPLQALHVLLQLSRVSQLLEDLESTRDTSALDLNTRTCRRNFPRTFVIPGTTVNSWLGN